MVALLKNSCKEAGPRTHTFWHARPPEQALGQPQSTQQSTPALARAPAPVGDALVAPHLSQHPVGLARVQPQLLAVPGGGSGSRGRGQQGVNVAAMCTRMGAKQQHTQRPCSSVSSTNRAVTEPVCFHPSSCKSILPCAHPSVSPGEGSALKVAPKSVDRKCERPCKATCAAEMRQNSGHHNSGSRAQSDPGAAAYTSRAGKK